MDMDNPSLKPWGAAVLAAGLAVEVSKKVAVGKETFLEVILSSMMASAWPREIGESRLYLSFPEIPRPWHTPCFPAAPDQLHEQGRFSAKSLTIEGQRGLHGSALAQITNIVEVHRNTELMEGQLMISMSPTGLLCDIGHLTFQDGLQPPNSKNGDSLGAQFPGPGHSTGNCGSMCNCRSIGASWRPPTLTGADSVREGCSRQVWVEHTRVELEHAQGGICAAYRNDLDPICGWLHALSCDAS